ncbi:MAG: hypothetical protein ACRBBN_14810 [Methyloligellaceae bacterium]
MQPYYHPTSITIIDDDPIFLESFSFYLSDDFRCHTFSYPDEGLRYIHHQEQLRHKTQHYFLENTRQADPRETTEHNNLRLKPLHIYKGLQSTKRFERISVAIVDYDMPGMNGLDVFRQISSCPIQKVLLTGKASIETAIGAKEDGIIDTFLMKQEHNLFNRIHSELKKLQKNYFENIAGRVISAKCQHNIAFMEDPAFQSTFEDLVHNRQVEEYYVSTSPTGVLMIQNDGSISFLHVNTEKELLDNIAVAEQYSAPRQLIELLETQKVLSIFPTEGGYYRSEHEKDWNEYIWPAQQITGQKANWYISLIDNDALPDTLSGKIASYNDFLDAIY